MQVGLLLSLQVRLETFISAGIHGKHQGYARGQD
jgi:hypothetical protein